MEDNRYAPPKAIVEDRGDESTVAPPLWNPNAASNWSLLFTPIFGTLLHLRNWEALGEVERARSARWWFWLSVVVVLAAWVGAVFTPPRSPFQLVRFAIFLLLVTWYFASAKSQAKWVASRFDSRYPRRGWTRPLLLAFVIYLLARGLFAALAGWLIG